MTAPSRRAALASERGSAVVISIIVLALTFAVAALAVQQSISAQEHTRRDEHVKRAQAAADAGIDAAIFQLDKADLGGALQIDPLNPQDVATQTCISRVDAGAAGFDLVDLPAGASWCPAVSEDLGASSYEYRISRLSRVGSGSCGGGATLSLDREIVSAGTSDGVTRRVRARLQAPVSLFSGAAVQSASSDTPMTMSGTASVLGNVHANHDIAGTGGAPTIAGNATPGPDHTVSGIVPALSDNPACQRFSLPLVSQGDAPTINDNEGTPTGAGWTAGCVDHLTGLVPVPCDPPLLPATGGVDWDAAKRDLRIWGNAKLTLDGRTYSFCKLRIEGQGILVVPAGATPTRIFLDAPGSCAGVTDAGQVTIDGLGRITNCHQQTEPASLQLYALGSGSSTTTQTLAGGAPLAADLTATLCGANLPLVGVPMTVYAPRSLVSLGGSTALAGQVAADVVRMSGAAAVHPVDALANLNAFGSKPILPLYRPKEYVECTARRFSELPADAPDQGC